MTKIKRTTKVVLLEVDGYTINGQPTCCAHVGGGRAKPRVCLFLGTRGMGMAYVCSLSGKDIATDSADLRLVPTTDCLLWKTKEPTNDRC